MDACMETIPLGEIRRALDYRAIIARMRSAIAAFRAGECDMPMPMHLAIAPEQGEVHIKSSYRRGGNYFVLKVASTFPNNLARGVSTSSGMMLLCSAETGQPLALLADEGLLTGVRTAAVAAMVAQDLGRGDDALGILGTGVQARLQARMHAEILPLRRVVLWGRTPDRVESCRRDLAEALPDVEVAIAASPAEVARETRLIVTATASRAPLLFARDLHAGTHISAVGSDSPGKQELDPEIVRRAGVVWLDSPEQCARLGEWQHIQPGERIAGAPWSVADFTGLGVEDLYIAEYVYENRKV
jgi:ornithine cyclodeaminase